MRGHHLGKVLMTKATQMHNTQALISITANPIVQKYNTELGMIPYQIAHLPAELKIILEALGPLHPKYTAYCNQALLSLMTSHD